MSLARTPIGEILLRHEHLRPRELERVLAESDRKQRLVSMLILRALIDGDDATLALSEQTGYPGALERHLEQRNAGLVKTFPLALMKSLAVVPLVRTAAGALVVLSRDPTPALADVLRSELATPIELAVTPAIFIERLVQRLANAAPPPTPPSLPPIDREPPNRHRKTVSVLMKAPLEPVPEPPKPAPVPASPAFQAPKPEAPVRISSAMQPVNVEDEGTAIGLPPTRAPAVRPTPPVIQIPERGSAPNPRPQPPEPNDSGNPRTPSPDHAFETRTPIGSRAAPRFPARPPPPPAPKPAPRPASEGISLELDADEPPPPERMRPTREIPTPDLQVVLDAELAAQAADVAVIASQPPVDDPTPVLTASSRPTRPAIIVPKEAMEAADAAEAGFDHDRPTRQNLTPPQRATPNIIKRPPTPLPVAPQPTKMAVEVDDEWAEPDPAEASIRPTRPKLDPPKSSPLTPPPPSAANEAETARAPLTPPPPSAANDAQTVRAPIFGKIATDLSIVREIERALSRATADRLLMKHAATRWNALLLVTVANERARGARGHGSRLTAGVESIDLTIASSRLLQAACDPTAAVPTGKDPLFELLGAPDQPSSAPVVVNDRVVAVLAAGDAINGGSNDELRALASALSIAYQRFPAKP